MKKDNQKTRPAPRKPSGMHIQGLMDSAYRMHKMGDHGQAELLYRQILQVEPGNPFSLYGLGTIAMARGEMEKAVALLHQSALNGYDAETVYTHLGIALQTLGRVDEALDVYRVGMKADAKNPQYPCNISVVLAQKGDHEGALKEARRAIKLDPTFIPAYVNAGAFLQALERYEDAAGMFEKILQLDPNHDSARQSLEAIRQVIVAKSL